MSYLFIQGGPPTPDPPGVVGGIVGEFILALQMPLQVVLNDEGNFKFLADYDAHGTTASFGEHSQTGLVLFFNPQFR